MVGLWTTFALAIICGVAVFIFCGWFDKKMENDEKMSNFMYKRDVEKMVGIKGSINFFKWVKENGTVINHGSKNKYIVSEVYNYMKDNDIPGIEHTHTLGKINEHHADYKNQDNNNKHHSNKGSHLRNKRKTRSK